MSIGDSTIKRIYRCHNCELIIRVEQKAKDDWIKKCPHCLQDEIYIHSGSLNVSCFVKGTKNPVTIGALADKNRDRMEKEGEIAPRKEKEKINFDILKNPQKYIKTGKI